MTDEPCGEMALLVQAELDGELDAAGAAALAGHVQRCAGCAGLQADLAALSVGLRGGLTRYAAPAGLRAAVLAAERSARRTLRGRPVWGYGASFGAGMAVAAGLAAFLVLPRDGAGVDRAEATNAVAAHIRALQPGHLVDVGSSDQHTVKPWFDGRLDFAPPVRDFGTQGFPLVGARLDYLAGRPVAALVYGRDKHLIDVFVWPGDAPPVAETVQGYHVVGWSAGGMNFRAVSDVNTGDLDHLARLIRGPG